MLDDGIVTSGKHSQNKGKIIKSFLILIETTSFCCIKESFTNQA